MKGDRGWMVALWLGVAAACLSTFPSREVLAGTEVLELLSEDADAVGVSSQLAVLMGGEVTLLKPPRLLTDSLRWAYSDPAIAVCAAYSNDFTDAIASLGVVPAPDSHAGVFPSLLQQAEVQLQREEGEAALLSTEQASAIIPCMDRVITPDEARRLFLYAGVSRVLTGVEGDLRAFRSLLAVEPEFHFERGYRSEVLDRFLIAVREQLETARVAVTAEGLADEAYLDGRPLMGVAHVLPGVHLLQVKSPFGEIRSTLVEVPEPPLEQEDNAVTLALGTVYSFGLPTVATVEEELITGLRAFRLTQLQIIGLDRYLSRKSTDLVIFSVDPPDTWSPGLRIYQLGGDVTDLLPAWMGPVPPTPVFIYTGLDVGLHAMSGEPFQASRRSIGYQLNVRLEKKENLASVTLGLTPHVLGLAGREASCDVTPLENSATEEQVEAVLACLPEKGHPGIRAEVGRVYGAGAGFQLIPMAGLQVFVAQNVVIADESAQPGGYLLFRTLMAGPAASVQLRAPTLSLFGRQVGLEAALSLEVPMAPAHGRFLMSLSGGTWIGVQSAF